MQDTEKIAEKKAIEERAKPGQTWAKNQRKTREPQRNQRNKSWKKK